MIIEVPSQEYVIFLPWDFSMHITPLPLIIRLFLILSFVDKIIRKNG